MNEPTIPIDPAGQYVAETVAMIYRGSPNEQVSTIIRAYKWGADQATRPSYDDISTALQAGTFQ